MNSSSTQLSQRQQFTRNRRFPSVAATFLAVLVIFNSPPSASAVPTLFISDGTNTASITSPFMGMPGTYSFMGNVGSWNIQVAMGLTQPTIGTATLPQMTLNYLVAGGAGSAPLTISFSSDFFGPSNALFTGLFSASVAAGGSATYATLFSTSNTLFAGSSLFGAPNPTFGPGAGAMTLSDIRNLPQFYALTQSVTISHGAAGGSTSGNFSLAATGVPEAGGTIALLGIAVAALTIARRRDRRTAGVSV